MPQDADRRKKLKAANELKDRLLKRLSTTVEVEDVLLALSCFSAWRRLVPLVCMALKTRCSVSGPQAWESRGPGASPAGDSDSRTPDALLGEREPGMGPPGSG